MIIFGNALSEVLGLVSVDQPDKKKKKTGVKKKSKHRKSSESETPAPAPSVEGKPEKEVEESKTADTSGTVVPDDEPELTVQADTGTVLNLCSRLSISLYTERQVFIFACNNYY